MVIGLNFLGLMFLVCFTIKLKIFNLASTSYESFAQHWQSPVIKMPPKTLNYTNAESSSEARLPYSQPLMAELGPHY